jgi:hypothetical protein
MQNAQRITWQFRLCCSKPWVRHVLAFRFANAFAEAFWNRNYSYFRFVLLFVRHGSGKDPREPTDGMSLIAAKIGGSTSVFIGIRGAV